MLAWMMALAVLSGAPGDDERDEGLPLGLTLETPEDRGGIPALLLSSPESESEDVADQEKHAEVIDVEPSELTPLNFFTEGWNQDWVKRSRKNRTPDMALLRVTTNFLERELRIDYVYTQHVKKNKKLDHSQLLNGLIAYGINRRLMVEVISNYQWNTPTSARNTPQVNGAGAAALVRLQLADTYDQSYAAQVRVSAPNRPIGQTAATVSPSLAGFQDLQVWLGLDRVGLYESLTYDAVNGPHALGSKTQTLTYAVSLAKTWTDPAMPGVGNLTTFLELVSAWDLNGPTEHHQAVSLTPGIRFWFVPENSLTFGVDFPVSQPHPFGQTYRLTYILNF
jgi:hypothetical protein